MAAPDREQEGRRQERRSSPRQDRAEPALADRERIVDAARARMEKLASRPDAPLPRERLSEVQALANLITDKDWQTPPSLTPHVLLALSHFVAGVDAADAAPAESAAELTRSLAAALSDELDGHREFEAEREKLLHRRFADASLREKALVQRRRQIRARIQARRWRREAASSG